MEVQILGVRWFQSSCMPMQLLLSVVWILLLLQNCVGQEETGKADYNSFVFASLLNSTWKFTDSTILCNGSASLTPANGSSNAMCLTPPSSDLEVALSGRCIYRNPVRLRNSTSPGVRSFSTMFKFNIETSLGVFTPGEGITFFMAVDNSTLVGGDSGYLGWLNESSNGQPSGHNFAVEFDIVQNMEFGDPSAHHIGVNVNSMNSTHLENSGYYQDGELYQLNITDSSDPPRYVWINYDGYSMLLDVSISQYNYKPERSTLSTQIDLSSVLQEFMYVGFSASTGEDAKSQPTVFDWSFSSDGEAYNIFGTNPGSSKSKKVSTALILSVSVAFAVLMIVLSVFVVLYVLNAKKVRSYKFQVAELASLKSGLDYGPQNFSYSYLKKATKGFSKDEILGRGGFGAVYKGSLPRTGTQVAVKRIAERSQQGVQEFLAEIKIIGRVRHLNLVPLLGWCYERGELLLVYKYMPNRSLDQWLSPANLDCNLSWPRRLDVLKGVASALVFLHEEWEQRVIHRDIKSSNVMLDSDFKSRLGDFGLARYHDHGKAPDSTRLAGTIGYMAPELLDRPMATVKTDVYSFGALTLEIVTGKKPSETCIDGHGLISWVWSLHEGGRVQEAIDSRLIHESTIEEVSKVIRLGLLCCNRWPDARPVMRQVLYALQGEATLETFSLNKPHPDYMPWNQLQDSASSAITFSMSTRTEDDCPVRIESLER